MTDDGGYELKPADPPPTSPPARVPDAATVPGASAGDTPAAPKLKPGDPGWTPPVPVIEQADADEPPEPAADPDIQQHKGLAVLGYVCFVIPLVAAPNSRFARYHANQGLLTFLALIAATVGAGAVLTGRWILGLLLARVALLDWFFFCGLSLLAVALLVGWIALVIQGILNAANGDTKPLPVIGHWQLIK
jgi:uncharacterized membrane protein